jgi:predicted component of type VI protein secretion system
MLERPRLVGLTDVAQRCLNGAELVIPRFPFRVGRESWKGLDRLVHAVGRAVGSETGNDLLLPDGGKAVNVSSSHFMIEEDASSFLLTDLQSRCGTIVEGKVIGGRRAGGLAHLSDHSVIIVGTARSPYIFKFRLTAP